MPEPDISGATLLEPEERDGLKFKHVTTRAELNELEQVNIVNGLLWLARRTPQDILTEAFVRLLHRRLFGEVWRWAGQFRRTQKNIGVDPRAIAVDLRNLLDDARYWAENGSYDPLEAAARFHHRLVSIHPFVNGNGRHARILVDVYLEDRFHKPPINWAAGQNLLRRTDRRDAYIAALRAADAGDLAPLLKFVGAVIGS